MRIILIGQAAFAEQVLDGLRERGHEVAAVYCRPDREGRKPDPVKTRAQALGVPVRQRRSLKAAGVQEEFADLGADLGVLAYVTQIVPPAVIETPRLGCICFHPSLLPRYRGGSAIPWQIIKGETRTGATVFWTDAGIDTGPILLQKEAEIGPEESAGSLYYRKLFPLGVETVIESVDRIASGSAGRVPQDDAQATYDPLLKDEHAGIDWTRPVDQVFNLIRGCDPQPGAFVEYSGTRLRFYDATRDDTAAALGEVASVDDRGIVVGATGGAIRAARLRGPEGKAAACDVARALGIEPGTRL